MEAMRQLRSGSGCRLVDNYRPVQCTAPGRLLKLPVNPPPPLHIYSNFPDFSRFSYAHFLLAAGLAAGAAFITFFKE